MRIGFLIKKAEAEEEPEVLRRARRGAWIAGGIGLACMCILGTLAVVASWTEGDGFGSSRWGAFGDAFGLLNPLASFASIALVYYAIILQRAALDSQQEALKVQRQDLDIQKEEYKLSNSSRAKQTDALSKQHQVDVTLRLFESWMSMPMLGMARQTQADLTARLNKLKAQKQLSAKDAIDGGKGAENLRLNATNVMTFMVGVARLVEHGAASRELVLEMFGKDFESVYLTFSKIRKIAQERESTTGALEGFRSDLDRHVRPLVHHLLPEDWQ